MRRNFGEREEKSKRYLKLTLVVGITVAFLLLLAYYTSPRSFASVVRTILKLLFIFG